MMAQDLVTDDETGQASTLPGSVKSTDPSLIPDSGVVSEVVSAIDPQLSGGAKLLLDAGPVGWIIIGLSIVATAITLWKVWRFAAVGVWRQKAVEEALTLWSGGARAEAREKLIDRCGVVGGVVLTAMTALVDGRDQGAAREETERVARGVLAELRLGLRGLEAIATIAPLLGLLGTVIGMIAAFQALQATGGRADPSALAGGIWEALLTTAAGMAVAIPAGVALAWCESVVDGARLRLDDAATRVFTASAVASRRVAA